MTAAELIQILATYPADMVVWCDGGGDPYCAGEITTVSVVESQGRTLMGHENSTPDVWLELS